MCCINPNKQTFRNQTQVSSIKNLKLETCNLNYRKFKNLDLHKTWYSHTLAVLTQRCFDVYATSITLKRRHINVKMTLCTYWVHFLRFIMSGPRECLANKLALEFIKYSKTRNESNSMNLILNF